MAKVIPKESVQKSTASLESKGWCEPERISLEDVADQWGTSISYVEECVRVLKFDHIILVCNRGADLPTTDHYIFNKAYWPFKGMITNRVGLRPAIFVHLHKRSAFPSGFAWGCNQKIFIPKEEARRIKSEKSTPSFSQPEISMEGHSPWLLAALDISTELYIKGKLVSHRGHRDQIEKLVQEKYGNQEWLTAKMKERIIKMVNKNPRGGSPRLNL